MNIKPIGFVNPNFLNATLELKYSAHFDDDDRRQNYPGSAHKRTKTILLRGPEDPGPENWTQDVPYFPTDLFKEWKAAQEFMGRVETHVARAIGHPEPDFGKIMIVRLEPGGFVDWHVDQGPYAVAYMRFHITLNSCWGAWLFSGGEAASCSAGNLLFFNNTVLHSAANFGDVARVNLICDVRRPKPQ